MAKKYFPTELKLYVLETLHVHVASTKLTLIITLGIFYPHFSSDMVLAEKRQTLYKIKGSKM